MYDFTSMYKSYILYPQKICFLVFHSLVWYNSYWSLLIHSLRLLQIWKFKPKIDEQTIRNNNTEISNLFWCLRKYFERVLIKMVINECAFSDKLLSLKSIILSQIRIGNKTFVKFFFLLFQSKGRWKSTETKFNFIQNKKELRKNICVLEFYKIVLENNR